MRLKNRGAVQCGAVRCDAVPCDVMNCGESWYE